MKGKYLITTNAWFYAPDGMKYRSVWGNVTIVEDSVLGIKTNRNSANWYARIGSDEKYIIVAGCQIFYAIKCENKPNTDDVTDLSYSSSGSSSFERKCEIYIAE